MENNDLRYLKYLLGRLKSEHLYACYQFKSVNQIIDYIDKLLKVSKSSKTTRR